jgi:glutamate formiminotransferase
LSSEDNMTQRVVECVPNFSDGRDLAKIRRITEAIQSVSAVAEMQPTCAKLLDQANARHEAMLGR